MEPITFLFTIKAATYSVALVLTTVKLYKELNKQD